MYVNDIKRMRVRSLPKRKGVKSVRQIKMESGAK